eukprot:scaffold36377_cov66-Phaeocystis_antarctica.AAC.9
MAAPSTPHLTEANVPGAVPGALRARAHDLEARAQAAARCGERPGRQTHPILGRALASAWPPIHTDPRQLPTPIGPLVPPLPTPLAGVGHADALAVLEGPHVGVDGRGTPALLRVQPRAGAASVSYPEPKPEPRPEPKPEPKPKPKPEPEPEPKPKPQPKPEPEPEPEPEPKPKPKPKPKPHPHPHPHPNQASTSYSTAPRAWASPTRTTDRLANPNPRL